MVHTTSQTFGQGMGDILIGNLMCTGNELSVGSCIVAPNSACQHSNDAGVTCNPVGEYRVMCLTVLSGNLKLYFIAFHLS